MRIKRNSKGFSMIEVVMVVTIIAIFANGTLSGFASALRFNSRQTTELKLKAWRKGIESFYFTNASTIELDANAELSLDSTGANVISSVTPNPTTKKCAITYTNFNDIATRANYASSDLTADGFHNSFCFIVTPRMSQTINGTTVYYHSIAVVSPGKNGTIEADTTLDANGNLNINPAKDDVGVLFDGRKFAVDKYNDTLKALNRVADAYSAYYSARYQSDSSRNLSIDYFSCGSSDCSASVARWDSRGSMLSTCSGAIDMVQATGISPHSVLGLSPQDVVDGFGQMLKVDNCSNAVRSPNNAASNLSVAPYSAIIYTTIPGGNKMTVTSVGQI